MRTPGGKPGTIYKIKASADSGDYQGMVSGEVEYKIQSAPPADSGRL